jgi:signal transduction histidine kinase
LPGSPTDELLAIGLARAAGMAIRSARLHTRLEEVRLAEDRERIAADLHDLVIQRLFAIGLSLQGCVVGVGEQTNVERIEQAIDDLDETIRQIRLAIFGLQNPRTAGPGVRGEILSLIGEAAASLGFAPRVALDGPIDALVGDHVADHLLAVLREALGNVARHAGAGQVKVTVSIADEELRVVVEDDGHKGGTPAAFGDGLSRLEERARLLGGIMEAGPRADGVGWCTQWSVPFGR